MNKHASYFLFLSLVLITFVTGCDSTTASREWYKQHFTEAAKENNNSRRMFMIWVGGDRQSYSKEIWIGASRSKSEDWFSLVDILLQGQRDAQVSNSPFLLELIADDVTITTQQENLKNLVDRFPTTFRVTVLDSIPAHRAPPREILDHARVGNPALASDALRLWYLKDPDYATNVYIDVDNFMDKAAHLYRYTDHKVFGLEVEPGAIYHAASNNDYIIDRNAPPQKIENIKVAAQSTYQQYERLFAHYKHRAAYALDPASHRAFDTYWKTLTSLVDYYHQHRDLFFDLTAATIYSGPGLLVRSEAGTDPNARENKGNTDKAVSAQAWKDGTSIPVDKSHTLNNLTSLSVIKEFFGATDAATHDELTKLILSLQFMGWDQSFFARSPQKDLAHRVSTKINEVWIDTERLVRRHLPHASTTTLAQQLKQATGGLFYSIMALVY